MAVKIRLRRMGQKKAPFYRIVVADSRSKRDGKCIAEIGTYDPNIEPSAYKVNEEEAKKWLDAATKTYVAMAAQMKLLVLSQQTLLQESSKRPESRNKKYFTEGISKVLS